MANLVSGILDADQENIKSQLEYAKALRGKSLDTQGQMIGPHYVAKDPWQNFLEGLAGGGVESYQRDKQRGIEADQRQQRQAFVDRMPSATETVAQEGPTQNGGFMPDVTRDKPMLQQAREWQKYGMEGLNIPGMEGIGGAAFQHGIAMPEKQAALEQARAAAEQARQERLAQQEAQFQQNYGLRQTAQEIAQQNANTRAQEAADRQRMAQEKADIKAAEVQQAKDNAAEQAKMQMGNIDRMIGVRDAQGNLVGDSKPHEGFGGYVGMTWLPGARLIEGTDAANYEALHKQVTSEARLQGVQMMKGSGSVSNAEGEAAAKALTSMSKAQSEKEYVRSALEYKQVLQRAVDRAARGVKVTPDGKEYSVGQQGAATPATSVSAGGLPPGVTVVRTGTRKDGTRNGKRVVQGSDGKVYDAE